MLYNIYFYNFLLFWDGWHTGNPASVLGDYNLNGYKELLMSSDVHQIHYCSIFENNYL